MSYATKTVRSGEIFLLTESYLIKRMIKVAIQYVVVCILFIFLSEAGVHESQHKWLVLKNKSYSLYFSKNFPSRVFIFLSLFDSEGIKTF